MTETTVLLVEDSESQRKMITARLSRSGYRVVAAASGRDALQLLSQTRPEIILLDVVMPELDGWETLQRIRAISDVPVIMLTVENSEVDSVRGLRGGADDYVGKPFRELELEARIEAVLRRASSARSDGLTGLGNYRLFNERLGLLVSSAVSGERQISVVLFDVDDFKQLNDGSGHAAGDEVLRAVARAALATLRVTEDAFRIGGDEFAILVEGGVEAAVIVAKRVAFALREERRGPALPTLSVGIASVPSHAHTKDDLLLKADQALYAAKRAGKNAALTYDDVDARSDHARQTRHATNR